MAGHTLLLDAGAILAWTRRDPYVRALIVEAIVEEAPTTMLREADLTPPPCGLQWGMSPGECLTALAIPTLRQDERWIEVNLPLGSTVHEARLWTDEGQGLQEIQVILHFSAHFPEESWNSNEVEAARADYEERYRRYIAEISGVLGAADGSSLPDPNNPRYEVGGGLTYWDRPTGRVKRALYQEGKHAPFELYLNYSADTFPVSPTAQAAARPCVPENVGMACLQTNETGAELSDCLPAASQPPTARQRRYSSS